MKVLVEAYGCTLNRGEAEEFADGLAASSHTLTENQEEADTFAIFTCGVIDTTERRMLKRISELAGMPGKKLLVCGCLPSICPERILRAAPGARLVATAGHMACLDDMRPGRRAIRPEPRAIGILPIATGCRGTCSYCITKLARGELISRSAGDLVARLKALVALGAVEIQLCAQDTAVYGRDIGLGLSDLVGELASVKGDFMMRIGMMNPASFMSGRQGIINAFDNPKVFKFLHLPVQSGSDRILTAMNRRHTAADFEALASDFRSRFPGASLSTDIITGFPGETDKDFSLSVGLVERMRPDIVNITRFSSRPGTEAHAMKNRVPSRISKDRSRVLTGLRFRITSENYAAMKGQTLRALAVERRKPGTTFLRTAEYKPVVVDSELPLGCWYWIGITGNAKTHLCGKLTEK